MIATKVNLSDCFKSSGSIRPMDEDASGSLPKLDPEVYLGRAIGEFFLIDGKSQNNRLYRRAVWEKALANVAESLKNGGLAGTFGHDRPLDEDTYCDGKISHKVTRLWIEGSVGMGEMLILNTPSGRALNTYLRAQLPVAVSSRALGSFLYEKGPDGEDVVDPETYILETFDMVLSPGVSSAYPRMVESLNNTNEEIQMAGEDLKPLYEQVATLSVKSENLSAKLSEAVIASQKDQAALNEAKILNEKLQKQVSFYRKYIGSPEDVKQIAESLRKFLEFEPFKSMANSRGLFDQNGLDMKGVLNAMVGVSEKKLPAGTLERAEENRKLVQQYRALGSIQEINRALSLLESYAKLGKPEQVAEAKKEIAEYKKLGTAAELNRALSVLENYAKLGKVSEVKQIFRVAEAYVRLGNPKALIGRLKAATLAEKKSAEQARKSTASRIAEKFEVAPAAVDKLLEKMGEAEVIETLKGMRETAVVTERFKITEETGKPESKPAISVPVGPKSLAEQMYRAIPRAEGHGVTKIK